MTSLNSLTLIGSPPSPYTRKMLGLLRYRRIPYVFKSGQVATELEKFKIEAPKPILLPTFILPNEDGDLIAQCDSTPIIRRLEKEIFERGVIPQDPALAFINYLLEDFADEWITKYMFHYRWYPEEDAKNAAKILPVAHSDHLDNDSYKIFSDYIGPRQIDRLWVVGSNDLTAPVIDASYKRFLTLMELHLAEMPFLFGNKPASADFAFFGQLTQLIGFDPTPRNLAHQISPRTVAWTYNAEDLSGLESSENWIDLEELPMTLKSLLCELGRGYVPALLANNRATLNGDEEWEAEIDNCHWTQKTFNYQAKCLNWIREEFNALSEDDKNRVNSYLEGTGCKSLLS